MCGAVSWAVEVPIAEPVQREAFQLRRTFRLRASERVAGTICRCKRRGDGRVCTKLTPCAWILQRNLARYFLRARPFSWWLSGDLQMYTHTHFAANSPPSIPWRIAKAPSNKTIVTIRPKPFIITYINLPLRVLQTLRISYLNPVRRSAPAFIPGTMCEVSMNDLSGSRRLESRLMKYTIAQYPPRAAACDHGSIKSRVLD